MTDTENQSRARRLIGFAIEVLAVGFGFAALFGLLR